MENGNDGIWRNFALPRESNFSRPREEGQMGDRKSTRLNSSHSPISYAVFCLKEVKRFTPAQDGGASAELYSIRFSSKKRGWIVGSLSRRDIVVDSLLLPTDDVGVSWQMQRAA